jgi:hypothetical protein
MDLEVHCSIQEGQDVGNPIGVIPDLTWVTRHATDHVGHSPACIAMDMHATRGGVDVMEKAVTKNVHGGLIVK